jgi:hypothetical protein
MNGAPQLMRLERMVKQASVVVVSAEEAGAWLDGLRMASEAGTIQWPS